MINLISRQVNLVSNPLHYLKNPNYLYSWTNLELHKIYL